MRNTITGSITRGLEYRRPESGGEGTMNYIKYSSFNYDRAGPEIEFTSASITVYLKPTLYLSLDYVGDVYFGFKPALTFEFEKETALSKTDCASYLYPLSLSLLFLPFLRLFPP